MVDVGLAVDARWMEQANVTLQINIESGTRLQKIPLKGQMPLSHTIMPPPPDIIANGSTDLASHGPLAWPPTPLSSAGLGYAGRKYIRVLYPKVLLETFHRN
jgi:hypothetical protein